MKYQEWHNKIKEWQDRYPICNPEYYDERDYVNPYVFITELSKHLKDDDIIIPDSGGTLLWVMQAIKPKNNNLIFSQFNHSAMGASIGMAIGAYYANPKRRIIAIMGDGSFCMNSQELETIAFNKIPIKMFILSNNEYGIINDTQKNWLDKCTGSDPSCGLGFPDIEKVAEAYGIETWTIEDHKSMNFLLPSLMQEANNPYLCVVKVKPGTGFNPKLKAGQPLENLNPFLPEDELKDNMLRKVN